MSISKPYYRIIRPKKGARDYVLDDRYADNRLQLSRAYLSMESKLVEIFNYVEPGDENEQVYSLELYTLLLRACTEVESNFKLILNANKYSTTNDNYTMLDYMRVEKSSKLSLYKVKFKKWRKENGEYDTYEMQPFKEFGGNAPCSPSWYKAYNTVKHNRETEFSKASLENVMKAIAGVLVLLYSQFGEECIATYGCSEINGDDLEGYDENMDADIIFEVVPPTFNDWGESESYEFAWGELKKDINPIQKFDFDNV